MTIRLWIDVEDLFEYARTNYRRPTGIQRLAFEVYRELQARYGDTGQVCFVQHSLTSNGFQVVAWSEVAALFASLTTDETALAPPIEGGPAFTHLPARRFVRRLAYRLSPSLRASVADALVAQGKALRSWNRLVSTLAREVVRARTQDLAASAQTCGRPLAHRRTVPSQIRGPCRSWRHNADARCRVVASGLFRIDPPTMQRERNAVRTAGLRPDPRASSRMVRQSVCARFSQVD